RYIVPLFGPKADGKRLRLPFALLAAVGGALLVGIFAVGYDLLAHAITWQFDRPRTPASFLKDDYNKVSVTASDVALIAVLTSPSPSESLPPAGTRAGLCIYWCWLGGVALLAWAFGRSLTFVNESSQQAMYRARLARAYLGASNPARWS